jgi:hypothetical protein
MIRFAIYLKSRRIIMEDIGKACRTIQVEINSRIYSINRKTSNNKEMLLFLNAIIYLFKANCYEYNKDYENSFSKLIDDLAFGTFYKCFDEIGDGVFTRLMGINDVVVKVKVTNDVVTIKSFYRDDGCDYDGRYMFS